MTSPPNPAPLADPEAWRRAFVSPEDWNAAVEHSRANPTHILGPYQDERHRMQIECTRCDFDTARVPAAGAGSGTTGGDQ